MTTNKNNSYILAKCVTTFGTPGLVEYIATNAADQVLADVLGVLEVPKPSKCDWGIAFTRNPYLFS